MPTPTSTPAPLSLKGSIAAKAARDLFLLSFFLVLALSTLAFAIGHQLLEDRMFLQLQQGAALGEDFITQALANARQRGNLVARDPMISTPTTGRLGEILLKLTKENDSTKGIAVFNHDLHLRASAGVTIEAPAVLPTITSITPRVSNDGWEWYDITIPTQSGAVVLRESADTLLQPLSAGLTAVSQSAALELAFADRGSLTLIRQEDGRPAQVTNLGPLAEAVRQRLPVAAGALGEEGTSTSEDERGHTVLAAVRSIPELGWGLAVQVDERDVFASATRLLAVLAASGGLLLVLGVLLSSLLSRDLTRNLRALIEKIGRLTPGRWEIDRNIHSGDEIELLDQVLVDVTTRLRGIYGHLETEVARRTQQVQELYALDRAVVESISYGVVTVDASGHITACNPSAAHLLMTTQEALNGHDLATAMPLLANGKPMAAGEHPVTECLIKKQPVRSRVSQRTALVRAQGDALPITITASPLLAGDQTNGAVIVFEDVTEERQIDAMKTEFIALAGHQLRTPVGALRWHIELLREGAEGLTEEQRSSLTEMQTLVERTVHLLNTLLQSAKLDEGAIEPSWTDVNLTPMLRDLVQSVSELAARSKVEVTLDLPENLTITTDQTLLSIVIYNIITNAVKYAKPGQGLVLLSAKDTGDSVVISVRDNGIGIPDEAKARLFEKFFRAKNAQVIDTDGNGLGLYISQSILSRLQGSIAFSSILDRGTTFTVTLPKHRANASGK